jgi:hydrogenase/urease accessory protein HupE
MMASTSCGRWFAAIALLLVILVALPASAHDFRPAVLELDEIATGHFVVRWRTTSALEVDGAPRYVPRFPAHCRADGASLDCGSRGLDGPVTIDGIETGYLDVAVRVRHLDGTQRFALLDADRPELELAVTEASPEPLSYVGLGIEHILLGVDHLLFVLGLTLLVGWSRRLLWTVTAFTVGHAVSLAASVLGWIRLPQSPVEAAIALSVLLVAVELTRSRATSTRRWPALVAGGFGLVHGLGFAGALREIGLPEDGMASALAAFNAGIELGQLVVVGLVLGGVVFFRTRLSEDAWARRVPAYAMGSLAAAWLVERVLAFWGGA